MDAPLIVGLGLQLREWSDADVPAMVALFDDPLVSRWTPLVSPFDEAAARTYVDQARARMADGRCVQLAITTDGGPPLGEVLLAPTGRTAELAYAVGPAHRGRRLATRAVRLMTEYAYAPLSLDHVVLRIAADNTASTAVARSCGFTLTTEPPILRHDHRPLLTWLHQPQRR